MKSQVAPLGPEQGLRLQKPIGEAYNNTHRGISLVSTSPSVPCCAHTHLIFLFPGDCARKRHISKNKQPPVQTGYGRDPSLLRSTTIDRGDDFIPRLTLRLLKSVCQI